MNLRPLLPTLVATAIFRGKAFMQVTIYDGPLSEQMSLKPFQDEAAENSNLKQPVAGSDRWKLSPRPDNRRYTLVCHYSGAPHELWSRQTASMNTDDMEIELPAGVSECFQRCHIAWHNMQVRSDDDLHKPKAACPEFSHAIPEEWTVPGKRFGRPGKRAGFCTNHAGYGPRNRSPSARRSK